MSTPITPTDEAGIIAAVQAARTAREPLAIEGHGSKRGMLCPVQAARSLSTRALTGVTLYRPAELIISARAGRPVARLVALAPAKSQPRPLGLGKDRFTLPKNFDSLHASEIQQMFEATA